MKELNIVYQNANYNGRCEEKAGVPFRNKNEVIKWCRYRAYFDDPKLQEQFGDPFEFTANIWKKIKITGLPINSAQWRMAEAILKSLYL